MRLKTKSWTILWASHSLRKTHINIDGFSINVSEQKSLPKGSKPDCFVSDNFPLFPPSLHNSLPSILRRKLFSRIKSQQTPPLWNSSWDCQRGDSSDTSWGLFFFLQRSISLGEIELIPRGPLFTQFCMLLFLPREDKWWTAKDISSLPLAGEEVLKVSLNWLFSNLTGVFLYVCFSSVSQAPRLRFSQCVPLHMNFSVSYGHCQRPEQGLKGPATGTVGQWAGAAEAAWSLVPWRYEVWTWKPKGNSLLNRIKTSCD